MREYKVDRAKKYASSYFTYKAGHNKCRICGKKDFMCRSVPQRIQKFEVQKIDGAALYTNRYEEIKRKRNAGHTAQQIAANLNKRGYINSWGRPVTAGSISLLLERHPHKAPPPYDAAEYEAFRTVEDLHPVWDTRALICFSCAPDNTTLHKKMRSSKYDDMGGLDDVEGLVCHAKNL